MPKLRVKVDQDLCTAEAICTGIAPRFYHLITNDAGEHKALVKAKDGSLHIEHVLDISDDDYDEILEAAERCPPKAIFVWEIHPNGSETQICP